MSDDTTAPETVRVAIVGPISQSKTGSYHIHDAQCPDLKRRMIYRNVRAEGIWEVDVTDYKDAVEAVYPCSDFQWSWDGTDLNSGPAAYEGDLDFFPCVVWPGEAPPERTVTGRGHSSVSKDGTMDCRTCKRTLEVTKFPTKPGKDGEVLRDDRCRECRDYARDGKKIGRPRNVPAPPAYGRPVDFAATVPGSGSLPRTGADATPTPGADTAAPTAA